MYFIQDGGYGGVEVCRLLLCLSGAIRGSGSTRQVDVHSYLCCTMRTFYKAVMLVLPFKVRVLVPTYRPCGFCSGLQVQPKDPRSALWRK